MEERWGFSNQWEVSWYDSCKWYHEVTQKIILCMIHRFNFLFLCRWLWRRLKEVTFQSLPRGSWSFFLNKLLSSVQSYLVICWIVGYSQKYQANAINLHHSDHILFWDYISTHPVLSFYSNYIHSLSQGRIFFHSFKKMLIRNKLLNDSSSKQIQHGIKILVRIQAMPSY